MARARKAHDHRWNWPLIAGGILLMLLVLTGVYHLVVSRVAGHLAQTSLDELDTRDLFTHSVDYGALLGLTGIERIVIRRRDTDETNALVTIEDLRVSPDIRAALRGKLAADVRIGSAGVNLLRSDIDRIRSTLDRKEGRRILTTIREAPINNFTLDHAYITWFDSSTDEPVQLAVDDIQVTARNMVHFPGRNDGPAIFSLTAQTFGSGYLDAFAEVELFREQPLLWAEVTLEDLQLAAASSAIDAYSPIRIEQGAYNLASSIRIEGEKLTGFLRQAILDFELESLDDPTEVFSLQTLALIYKQLRDDEDGNLTGTAEFNTHVAAVEGGRVRTTAKVLMEALLQTFDLEETERLETEDISAS